MGNVLSSVGDFVGNTVGGLTGGIAKGLTPQNGYNVGVGQSTQQIQGNQQALAQALLAQTQGQGPNPAQAALQQATNQNIQQNTGMIASQKGINPALATRLAAENQGNMSQQAAGQGAILQAQQQLGAQSQLGNTYAQEQQGTNAANSINAGVASGNQTATANTTAGLLNGAGNAAMAFANKGGIIPKMADGGSVESYGGGDEEALNSIYDSGELGGTPALKNSFGGNPFQTNANQNSYSSAGAASSPYAQIASSPEAINGSLMSGAPFGNKLTNIVAASKGGQIPAHLSVVRDLYHPQAAGGKTPVMLSPGERKLSPADAKKVAAGKEDPIKNSKLVPGKAPFPGDNPKNDIVKTSEAPGTLILPKSVTESADPSAAAAKFVADHIKGANPKDFKGALKKAMTSRKGA